MVVLYQERCVWRYIQFTFFFIWHLHFISFIALAYGVMSQTYGSDRTGTASFIGHDMALHFIGIMFLGCEVYALEYDFGRYWKEVIPN